jgi:hypothetical protein
MKTFKVTLDLTRDQLNALLSSLESAKKSESPEMGTPGACWSDGGGCNLRRMPPTPELQSELVTVDGKVTRDVYVIARAAADIEGQTWDEWLNDAVKLSALAALESVSAAK